jgi:hypothetical protein
MLFVFSLPASKWFSYRGVLNQAPIAWSVVHSIFQLIRPIFSIDKHLLSIAFIVFPKVKMLLRRSM